MTTTTTTEGLKLGARYRVPSGMGGVFDVRLLAVDGATASLSVDSPRNPDWHGWRFSAPVAELGPIPILFEVRTRSLVREQGLVWGRYPTREEAERAAERARAYPSCHPVSIAPVEG